MPAGAADAGAPAQMTESDASYYTEGRFVSAVSQKFRRFLPKTAVKHRRRQIMLVQLLLQLSSFVPRQPTLAPARGAASHSIRMALDPAVLQSLSPPVVGGAGVGVVVSVTAVRQAAARRGAEAAAAEAEAAAAMEDEAEGEMSIGQLLREYGVIALLFHFTVWLSTIGATYSALSLAGTSWLESVPLLSSVLGESDGAGATAGSFGLLAVTLGIVEAIGPARLALTVAATPAISTRAREYAIVRDTEARIMEAADGLLARLPGGGD